METGGKVKQVREALHLNQKEFAEPLGIRPNYVSQIESGQRTPSGKVIALMFACYQISRQWWDTGEGPMFDRKEEDAAIQEMQYLVEQIRAIPKDKRFQLIGKVMEIAAPYLNKEKKG